MPEQNTRPRWLGKATGAPTGQGNRRYPYTRSGDKVDDITRRITLAYRNQLNPYMGGIYNSILPYERTVFGAQKRIAPEQAQLETDIYRQQAPQLEQTNYDNFARFYPQYANLAANTDLQLLQGAGGQAALQNLALQRQIDPEFFASREAALPAVQETLAKARQLIGGMDPNKLTESELENVTRGLNRSRAGTGDLNTPSNMGAISSAMTFGDELNKKRSGVAQAIASVMNTVQGSGQFGQMSRSGVNPMEHVNRSGAGTGQFGQAINQLGANKTVQRQPIGQGGQYASSFIQLPADMFGLERQLDKTGNWDLGQVAAQNLIPSISLAYCSRTFKENFEEINPETVLEKVAQLPIERWNYINDHKVKHVSPMAEDFHKEFGLGENNLTINLIDAFGIALASIQALKRRVEQLENQVKPELK